MADILPPELGAELAPPALAAPEAPMETGEILSQSLLGGREVKPGDTITLVVQSVNDEDGTFTATPDEGGPAEAPSGIGEMAAAFDQ